jgi:hypothetical protein
MLYVTPCFEISGIFINSLKNLPKPLKRRMLRYISTESCTLSTLVLTSGSDGKLHPSKTYPQALLKHILSANQVFINYRKN